MFFSAVVNRLCKKTDLSSVARIRRKSFKNSLQIAYTLRNGRGEARIHLMGSSKGTRFYRACRDCSRLPPAPCWHYPGEKNLTSPDEVGDLVEEVLGTWTDPLSASLWASDAAIYLRQEAQRYAHLYAEAEQAALVAHERRKALEKKDATMNDPYLALVRFSPR